MPRETIGRPMEILLVEDSLPAARIAIGALAGSRIDHRLSWMKDGREAHEFLFRERKYAQAPRPDLILLDLSLPEIDGRELLKQIRSDESLREIPVIIMTGTAGEEQADEFRTLDVQGFLVKPVNLPRFLQIVEELKRYWKSDMILAAETPG